MGREQRQRVGRASGTVKKPLAPSPTKQKQVSSEALLTPKRNSLIAQTIEAIRQRIAERIWVDRLPGERTLCEVLQISRPTLRSALAVLQRDGTIGVVRSKPRRIRKSGPVRSAPSSHQEEIILLSPEHPSQMQPSTLFLIEEMHNYLQKAGFKLKIESPAWLSYAKPGEYAAEFVRENPCACWALFSVSRLVQEWFSAQSLPALVSGSCFRGVSLPSIDYNYRAVAQHAAGMFRRRNHLRMTLLMPENMRPGDAVTMEAFLEAAQAARGVKVRALRASSDHANFERQLKDLLEAGNLPHGLFITDALKTLHALTYLLKRGSQIGPQISLISRDEDFYFEHLSLRPACYRLHKEKFAAKFCRMLGQLAQSGTLPSKPVLITPDFQKGDTV